jgi:acetoin utilization deacetylase AcuC-like enzyme
MKAFYTDHYVLPLPQGHRFPMRKYALLRQRVSGAQLACPIDLCEPHAATDEEILRAHTPAYLRAVCEGTLTADQIRRIGFPWSPEMVERSRRSSGATIEACRAALEEGVAVNLAGGTHHAFADAGEGYCVFNDSAIAARAMQAEKRIQRAIIVDCDVHQGNGTAAILQNDPTIFTFSIHGAKNFPLRKESSDLDVEVPDNTTDGPYLEALEEGLWQALHRAGAELAIYLAGADPYEGDRLGRLKLTWTGLAERDRLVFRYLDQYHLPVAVCMAGGYAPDVNDVVEIHFQTVRLAAERWQRNQEVQACPRS